MKVIYFEEVERERLICDTCKDNITKKKMYRVFQDGCDLGDGNYQALDFCSKKCSTKWIEDNISIESIETELVKKFKKNLKREVEYEL